MEYLDGRTLKELIVRTGRRRSPIAIDYARQILARARASRTGTGSSTATSSRTTWSSAPTGALKVTDFGIARSGAVADDRGRLDHRHGAVPLARAGARRAGRPALRPLLGRRRPLRDADREGAVHRRHAGRDRDEAPLARCPSRRRAAAGGAARPRRGRAARAREGPGRPLRDRRGDGRRPRPRRARRRPSAARRRRRRRRCSPAPASDRARRSCRAAATPVTPPPPPAYRPPGAVLRLRGAAARAARSGRGSLALLLAICRGRRRLVSRLRADPGPAEREQAGRRSPTRRRPSSALADREARRTRASRRGRSHSESSDDRPAGAVYDQIPGGGDRIDKGNDGHDLVSTGKPKTTVPDVAG